VNVVEDYLLDKAQFPKALPRGAGKPHRKKGMKKETGGPKNRGSADVRRGRGGGGGVGPGREELIGKSKQKRTCWVGGGDEADHSR